METLPKHHIDITCADEIDVSFFRDRKRDKIRTYTPTDASLARLQRVASMERYNVGYVTTKQGPVA